MPGANSEAGVGPRALALALLAAFAIVVIRSGWMHDDAYITFRTADNFINGFGLRWNVAERVQTYTHPLWMLSVTALYAATHEIYVTVLAWSVLLSVAAVALVTFGTARTPWSGSVAALVLLLSKAFIDYSTSGLENPLTHVLLALFLALLLRRAWTLDTLHLLATIAALATLNRSDTLLLFAPALLAVWRTVDRRSGLAMLVAGFVPFIVWELFAVAYYGFPFPNTAYAKLFATGIGLSDRVQHGLFYLQNSLRLDPLTLTVTALGVAAGFSSRDRRLQSVALGVVLYLMYVVYIGGDFVTGRFLTAPLLGAAVIVAQRAWESSWPLPTAAALTLVLGFAAQAPTPLNGDVMTAPTNLMDPHGVADERLYYYPYTGVLRAWHGVHVAQHPWAAEGLAARSSGVPITVRGDIGFFGFYAGPSVHIVDVWGLADPLIARTPARAATGLRVGHYTRDIPAGYPETLVTGRTQLADAKAAKLYNTLAVITRGPLLSADRVSAIVTMNLRGSAR